MPIKGMKADSVLEMAREDFTAATNTRANVEDAKIRALRNYSLYRDDVPGGSKAGPQEGPFGWSQVTVPIIAWVVETALPRLGVMMPNITVTAKSPSAVQYAEAKQLRLNADLKAAHSEEEMMQVLKSMLLYGDGYAKTPWDSVTNRPGFHAVSWWDLWFSSEADRAEQAEVVFHRTWHTKRDLDRLAARKGPNGRRLYDKAGIEELHLMIGDRSADDRYMERREAAGLGGVSYSDMDDGVVQVVECWYRDGARVVIGGPASAPVLLRVVNEEDYPFLDNKGRPFRPFAFFHNTPNLHLPYSIGYGELLENHQQEATLLRNQNLDQASGNLFAPIGYDARKVRPEEITQAWSSPGGLFGTDGPPNDAVVRFAPGGTSRDFSEMYTTLRNEAQLVAGVSDLSAGMASASGMDANTATGTSLIVGEANKRFQLLLKFVEMGMRRVAENFDYLDRLLGGGERYMAMEPGFTIAEYSQGISDDNGMLAVDDSANAPDMEYEITVDAGAMSPPAGQEQAKRVMALVQALSMLPPPVQMQVDWQQVMRMIVEAHGYPAERIMAPQQPPAPPEQMVAQQPGGQNLTPPPDGNAMPPAEQDMTPVPAGFG